MDNLKRNLAIFFGVFFVSSFVVGAYLDSVSITNNGNQINNTNPIGVRLTDGTNYVATLPVSLTSTTITNFPTVQPINDNGGSLTVDGSISVSNFPALYPVSDNGGSLTVDASSWPLPTGASTSALQSTGNTSLNNIDVDLDVALSTRASAANQTNGTQKTRITSDGTNDALVTNAAPLSTSYGIAVRPIALELATHSIVATNVVVGNNKSMLAIQNTGTSIIRIREIWIINDRTTAVTGVAGLFEVRRITSFSGGTAITPVSYDTADTTPAGITAATGSTVAGEGVLLRSGVWSTDEWGPGTLDTESNDHANQQTEPFWKQTPNGKALTVRQNQGVHVKFATNSTAGEFNIRIVFTVE